MQELAVGSDPVNDREYSSRGLLKAYIYVENRGTEEGVCLALEGLGAIETSHLP